MTCKRLRLAIAILVGLSLLGAPAVRALPGFAGGEVRAVHDPGAPGLLSGLWDLLASLLPGAASKNRASIDPDGASSSEESDNRVTIDPNGSQAEPESDNRVSIDPDG